MTLLVSHQHLLHLFLYHMYAVVSIESAAFLQQYLSDIFCKILMKIALSFILRIIYTVHFLSCKKLVFVLQYHVCQNCCVYKWQNKHGFKKHFKEFRAMAYISRTLVSCLPSPAVDSMWAVMVVWKIRGEIIRTVLCWGVCDSCKQSYADTHEQFLKLSVDLGLGLIFCVFI